MANLYHPTVNPIWRLEHGGRGYGPFPWPAQGGMCSTAFNSPHHSTCPPLKFVSILPQLRQPLLIVSSCQAPLNQYDSYFEGARRWRRIVRLLSGGLRRVAHCATDARTRANTEANRQSMYWVPCPHCLYCQMPGVHHVQCPFYQQIAAVLMQQPERPNRNHTWRANAPEDVS